MNVKYFNKLEEIYNTNNLKVEKIKTGDVNYIIGALQYRIEELQQSCEVMQSNSDIDDTFNIVTMNILQGKIEAYQTALQEINVAMNQISKL